MSKFDKLRNNAPIYRDNSFYFQRELTQEQIAEIFTEDDLRDPPQLDKVFVYKDDGLNTVFKHGDKLLKDEPSLSALLLDNNSFYFGSLAWTPHFLSNPKFCHSISLYSFLSNPDQDLPVINSLSEAVRAVKAYSVGEHLYSQFFPVLHVLYTLESAKVNLDTDTLDKIAPHLQNCLDALNNEVVSLLGKSILLSSPKQVSKLLYTDLKFRPVDKTESTSSDVLVQLYDQLSPNDERKVFLDILIDFRKNFKLLTGILQPLKKAAKNGKISCRYRFVSTGRLAAYSPNLQQLPRTNSAEFNVRKLFKAKSGFVFLSLDYKQLEARILGHFSDDAAFLETLNSSDFFANLLPKKSREINKKVFYALIYGASSRRLAIELGVTDSFINEAILELKARFPRIFNFLQNVIKESENNPVVSSILGRKRYLQKGSQLSRQAVNTTIQSSAADIQLMALIQVHREYREYLFMNWHDEIILEVPAKNSKEIATKVADIMKNVLLLKCNLEVSCEMGFNLGEMQKFL